MNKTEFIWVDMDGVIANFIGGMCSLYNIDETEFRQKRKEIGKWDGINAINKINKSDMSYDDLMNDICKTPDFWFDLEPLESGKELINNLIRNNHDIGVLTTVPEIGSKKARIEKRIWLAKHYPKIGRIEFAGGENNIKKHGYARAGIALIDDKPDNIVNWINAGGTGIIWDSVAPNFSKIGEL